MNLTPCCIWASNNRYKLQLSFCFIIFLMSNTQFFTFMFLMFYVRSQAYKEVTGAGHCTQARIQGGGPACPGPPPLLRQKKKKKRGERERKEKKKKRGKRKRDIKKLRCHNLFVCAYIGLHWPMGGAGGSRHNKRMGNIEKHAVFMHQKLET